MEMVFISFNFIYYQWADLTTKTSKIIISLYAHFFKIRKWNDEEYIENTCPTKYFTSLYFGNAISLRRMSEGITDDLVL